MKWRTKRLSPKLFPMESSKEMIADTMVAEVRSWAIGKPEPPKDTYRCLICDYSTLGEENCVNHVTEEHDDVLEAELRMKN